jgi:hypothetical protein
MAATDARSNNDVGRVFSIANLILGAWLIVSAFAWPHSYAAQSNTWVCGLAIAGFALWAVFDRDLRWVTTTLGVWLFISAFVLPSGNSMTLWNNIIVSLLVIAFSLTEGDAPHSRHLPMGGARA